MGSLKVGPPRDAAPGVTGTELLLGKSDTVAVTLGPLFVWPQGVRLVLWIASQPPLAIPDPVEKPLLFGVEVAGERPGLLPLGGGGGQCHFLWEHWLFGLPPEGAFKLTCAWPEHGIPETTTELDSRPIREAAQRVRPLWPAA